MLIVRVANINPDDVYVLAIRKFMERLHSKNNLRSSERDGLMNAQIASRKAPIFSDIGFFVSRIKDYKTAIDLLTEVSQYDEDYTFKIEACKMALQRSIEHFQVYRC